MYSAVININPVDMFAFAGVFTQRWLAVTCRGFETNYRSHLQGWSSTKKNVR